MLHEFQAKKLLSGYGIHVPMGDVAASPTEAQQVAERLGCKRYAVKAQILTNDRQQINAIRYATSPLEVAEQARRLLGVAFGASKTPAGAALPEQVAHRVLVEEFIESRRELYAAVVLEPSSGRVALLASAHGGSGIETRTHGDPEAIHRVELTLKGRRALADFEGLARAVSPSPDLELGLAEVLRNMAVAFASSDALLVEVNPLAVTGEGQIVAVDAKMRIDANALFRHPELSALQLENERLEAERRDLEAQRYQVNFVTLDGDIGVAVNGAGLALATHDLVSDAGGKPSNFMDIRTTASSLDIAQGFELLLRNPRTKAIFVNVHGGGMQRCDTIAEGLGIAMRRVPNAIPIVIRMAGNNADFARTVLRNNGVQFHDAISMMQGAQRVVELSRKETGAWRS